MRFHSGSSPFWVASLSAERTFHVDGHPHTRVPRALGGDAAVKAGLDMRRLIVGCVGVIAFVIVGWLIPCPERLAEVVRSCGHSSQEAMRCLGSLAFAVVWWVGAVAPTWVPALIIVLSWTVFDAAPFPESFAPFSETMVWQLAGIFVLASAAKETGILERIALRCMGLFGTSYPGQVMAMGVSGLVSTPIIPAIAAKSLLGASIAMDVSDAMKLDERSKGRTGLYLASIAGYSCVFPAILSSSAIVYLTRSLMPEDAVSGLSWIGWLSNTWVWLLCFLVLYLSALILLYNPKGSSLPDSFVSDRRKELGRLSPKAKAASAILVACVLLWVFEGLVGLSVTQVSLLGALAMYICGVLDPKELGKHVNWTFLVFIGCILSLGARLVELGVSAWLSDYIAAALAGFVNPFALLALLFLSTVLVNLVLTSQVVVISVFMGTLIAALAPAGFSPFIIGFVLMLACNSFVVPYENPTYIIALESTKGAVAYRDTFPGALLYVACSLTSCLISIPYWMAIGAIG